MTIETKETVLSKIAEEKAVMLSLSSIAPVSFEEYNAARLLFDMSNLRVDALFSILRLESLSAEITAVEEKVV